MNNALRDAIYTTGKTVTGLSATNFRHNNVPQETAYPYCVFKGLVNPISRDSATDFEENHVQFSFYGDVVASIDTLAIALQIKFDYGKANLSVSGYTITKCLREFTIPARKIDNVWQIDLQYNIGISKSR